MADKMASKDNFANKFYGKVVESAANTLTFAEIKTNVSIFEKAAWVLHRLEFYLSPTDLAKLLGGGDSLKMAFTMTDKITSLGLDSAGVIDMLELQHHNLTSVGFSDIQFPVIRDFTGLPGGGIIIAPRPLFVAAQGVSLATAITIEVRGYFTMMALSADQYLDLVDFYRIVS